MPNVEHSTLTNAEIHEPKGVSAASEGQVYIANGLGSGTWQYIPTGWAYYQDGGSAQTINTTASKLSVDGAGSLTNTDFLPFEIRGADDLWDTGSDKITPIRVGDAYEIRIDLPITADSGSPNELTTQFDISGLASPTTVILTRYDAISKTPPFTLSFSLPIVALTSTTVSNGVQIFMSTDSGSITVTNPSITVIRNHGGEL